MLWLRNKAAMEKSVSRLFWRTDLDPIEGVALETKRRVTYVDCCCLPLQIKLSYALIDFICLRDYFSSQGFTLIRLLISLNFENN